MAVSVRFGGAKRWSEWIRAKRGSVVTGRRSELTVLAPDCLDCDGRLDTICRNCFVKIGNTL
jgi:hypothetical protein